MLQNFNYDAAVDFYNKRMLDIFNSNEAVEQKKLERNEETYNKLKPDGTRPSLRLYLIPDRN